MTLNVTLAAQQLGITDRQVRRAIGEGLLQAERVGSSYIIHPRQVQAYARIRHGGRHWNQETQEAALSILSNQPIVGLTSSEKSRLKSRIETLELSSLVGQLMRGRFTLRRGISAETSALPAASVLPEIDLSSHGNLAILVHQHPTDRARELQLALDQGGNVVVIHGSPVHQKILEACALYIFGDAREHSASRAWLEQKKRINGRPGVHSS